MSFLTGTKREEFSRTGRFMARQLAIEPLPGAQHGVSLDSGAVETADALRELVHSVAPRQRSSEPSAIDPVSMRVAFVSVRPRDGMTWMAESTFRTLKSMLPHFEPFPLGGRAREGGLPEIAGLVSEKAFWKLAETSGLLKSRWRTTVARLLIGALGTSVVMLRPWILRDDPVRDWGLYVASALMLLFAFFQPLMAEVLAQSGLSADRSAARTDLLKQLESNDHPIWSDEERNGIRQKFVDLLASSMAHEPFPRLVVIDDYEQLDPITADVVFSYLHDVRKADDRNAEIWCIFERAPQLLCGKILVSPEKVRTLGASIYRVLPLPREMLMVLDSVLGRESEFIPPDATIKDFCDRSSGATGALHEVERLRVEHRETELFGPFSLLCFLSLPKSGAAPYFSIERLESELSSSRGRGTSRMLLQRYLDHSAGAVPLDSLLSKRNFHAALVALRRRARAEEIFELRADRGSNGQPLPSLDQPFRVRFEIASQLRSAGRNVALGHLAWALHMWERRSPADPDRAWIERLADHLQNGCLYVLPNQVPRDVFDEYVTASLWAVESSLKAGPFNIVPQLLRNCVQLLVDPEWANGAGDALQRAEQLAWRAFSTLGSDELLQLWTEAVMQRKHGEQGADLGVDSLEELFLASLPLSQDERRTLRYWASNEARSDPHGVLTVGRARAAWLAVTASVLVPELTSLRTASATVAMVEDGTLETILRDALDKLKERPDVAQMVSASSALWAAVLLLTREVSVLLQLRDVQSSLVQRVSRIVELSEEAIQIAHDWALRTRVDPRSDLLFQAANQELCAVALGSACAAVHLMGGERLRIDVSVPLCGRIERMVQAANEGSRCAIQFDSTSSWDTLLDQVDAFLQHAAFTWLRFGLDVPYTLLRLRQLHLRALRFDSSNTPAVSHGFESGVRLASGGRGGFIGMLIHLIRACCEDGSRELRGAALGEAVAIVLRSSERTFARGFAREIFLLGAYRQLQFQFTTEEVTRGIDSCLVPDESGEAPLIRHLRALSPKIALALSHQLLSLSRGESGLAARTRATLREFAGSFGGIAMKDLEAWIDYHELRESSLRGDRFDVASVLERWAQRKEHPTYASVLMVALQEGNRAETTLQLVRESLERDPRIDAWNSHLNLAIEVLRGREKEPESFAVENLEDAALSYVARGIDGKARLMSYKENIDAYRFAKNSSEYNSQEAQRNLEFWREVEGRILCSRSFSASLERSESFNVLVECVSAYGSDLVSKPRIAREDIATEVARKESLGEWKSKGRKAPGIFEIVGGHECISGDFYRIGMCLFSPPAMGAPEWDEDRRCFNVLAMNALPRLWKLLLESERIPPGTRELVLLFQQRSQVKLDDEAGTERAG